MYSEGIGVYGFKTTGDSEQKDFGFKLTELLKKKLRNRKEIVILCIGSDYYVGDCLGPLIGHKLLSSHYDNLIVYGTLKEPVHAKNLNETIQTIYSKYANPLVIAIDSSLDSDSDSIGDITLREGSISPGIAFEKSLPSVGHISILGIVNLSGISFDKFIQTTRMHLVMTLADFIVKGLLIALDNLNLNQEVTKKVR